MRCGVVIPVRGFAPFLAEAVESVLAEGPAAVVVVDDASPEPLALHPDHAAHVRLLRLERSAGPGNARAEGEARLPREIEAVALCDADDAWTPGSLAPRLQVLRGAAWCCGAARVVGADGLPTGEAWPAAATTLPGLYVRNGVCTSSVVLRREALAAAGGLHGGVPPAEDWDLWLRLAAGGARGVALDEVVVRYRRHPGALTHDVAALARAQRAAHERHGHLVDARTRRAALRRDDAALAGGLARAGDLRGAVRAALRGRALRPVLAGLRRRDPYRR